MEGKLKEATSSMIEDEEVTFKPRDTGYQSSSATGTGTLEPNVPEGMEDILSPRRNILGILETELESSGNTNSSSNSNNERGSSGERPTPLHAAPPNTPVTPATMPTDVDDQQEGTLLGGRGAIPKTYYTLPRRGTKAAYEDTRNPFRPTRQVPDNTSAARGYQTADIRQQLFPGSFVAGDQPLFPQRQTSTAQHSGTSRPLLDLGSMEARGTSSTTHPTLRRQEEMPYNWNPRSPQKPKIIPDRYDGSGPWRDFKAHFESCAFINDWSQEEKAQFLAVSLKGAAQMVIGDLPQRPSYAALMEMLEGRFGPGKRCEVYLAELRNRTRKPNESLQELAQSIRRTSALAYPDLTYDAQERLAKTHFIDAIDDREVRVAIFQGHPRDLDSAVKLALEIESYLQADRMRGGVKPKYRQVNTLGTDKVRDSNSTQPDVASLKREIEELRKELWKQRNQQTNEPPKAIFCYGCGEPGHIRRRCPRIPQAQSGNEKGPVPRAGERPTRH